MKRYVIITAGGKGERIGASIPKQFLYVGSKPMLMLTIESFYKWDAEAEIILVLPETHRDFWLRLCDECTFNIPYQVVNGGETRFHSVKNGLTLVQERALVAVHDGARPLVGTVLIEACFAAAQKWGSAVPAVDLKDSIRQRNPLNDISSRADRNLYAAVQTPQVFRSEYLHAAYEQYYSPEFTDDASVVEAYGVDIHLIQGEETNIKITTPLDIYLAEIILRKHKKEEQTHG